MPPLVWIAVALMLVGAVMLVADMDPAALWFAVITVGIALLVVEHARRRNGHHRA